MRADHDRLHHVASCSAQALTISELSLPLPAVSSQLAARRGRRVLIGFAG
jgi:hypothetical protein